MHLSTVLDRIDESVTTLSNVEHALKTIRYVLANPEFVDFDHPETKALYVQSLDSLDEDMKQLIKSLPALRTGVKEHSATHIGESL